MLSIRPFCPWWNRRCHHLHLQFPFECTRHAAQRPYQRQTCRLWRGGHPSTCHCICESSELTCLGHRLCRVSTRPGILSLNFWNCKFSTSLNIFHIRILISALAMTLLVIPLAMIGIPVRIRVFSDSFFAIIVPVAIIDRPVWIIENAFAVLLVLLVLSHVAGATTESICSFYRRYKP